MKKICLLLVLCSLVNLACNLSVAMTPPTETGLETASQPTDTVIAVTEEAETSTASATPEIATA